MLLRNRWAWRHRRGEEGYALATVVALTFIIITTITAVFTLQLSNIEQVRRANGQSEGRAVAEAGVDGVFVKALNLTASPANASALLPFDPTAFGVSVSVAPGGTWVWVELGADGKYQVCSAAKNTCQHFSIITGSSSNDYVVEVATRSRCLGATLDGNGAVNNGGKCVVTKYQQRIRRKQYFDYLSFTSSETLGSGFGPTVVGTNVPYSGFGSKRDELHGPVRTDGTFYVCSGGPADGPWFASRPEHTGPNGQFNDGGSTLPGCGGANAIGMPNGAIDYHVTPIQVARLGMPGWSEFANLCPLAVNGGLALDGSGSPIAKSGCPQVGSTPRVAKGDISVVLQDDTYGVCAQTSGPCTPASFTAIPAGGVMYLDARAVYVKGILNGRLTIVSTGDIFINGDLRYTSYQSVSQPGNGSEALGLISGGGTAVLCSGAGGGTVVVDQAGATQGSSPQQTCAAGSAKRVVNGAILALGVTQSGSLPAGTIYAENWATSGPGTGGALPTLEFYGSMASKTRGPFGAYTATGGYAAGFIKDFTFDKRLRDVQPPYFLEPTNAQWERVDLTEVTPCAAGLGGVSPQGAGC